MKMEMEMEMEGGRPGEIERERHVISHIDRQRRERDREIEKERTHRCVGFRSTESGGHADLRGRPSARGQECFS